MLLCPRGIAASFCGDGGMSEQELVHLLLLCVSHRPWREEQFLCAERGRHGRKGTAVAAAILTCIAVSLGVRKELSLPGVECRDAVTGAIHLQSRKGLNRSSRMTKLYVFVA